MSSLTVDRSGAGERLDKWLALHVPSLSRSRIQALVKSGHITVDGRCAKPHHRLATNAEIRVVIPPPVAVDVAPEDIPLDVLYEDADVIVVNKPPGLVVHPAPGHPGGTLVNALLHHCRDLGTIGGDLRPGIVHRLDKDTSGVMVVAKNEAALRSLAAQFKRRSIEKRYIALVAGQLHPPAGRVETLIGRSRHDRQKMSARPARGRQAVTTYETIEVLPGASLVRVGLETGRTHQIRVHMSHLGHPVAGDAKYGRSRSVPGCSAPVARQMLHAERLAFRHPRTKSRMEFSAPLPPDMETLVEALRAAGRAGSATIRG